MNRLWIPGAAVLAVLAALVTVTPAAEPTKEEIARKNAATVERLSQALQLADVGRQAVSAEALVGAAKILNEIEALTELKGVKGVDVEDPKTTPKPGELIKGEAKPADLSDTIKELLDDARKLAKNDAKLLAVIDGVKVSAGRGGSSGPQCFKDVIVRPNFCRAYTVDFCPGEKAVVSVKASGPVTLEVFNAQGVVRVPATTGTFCVGSWTPSKGHGPFTIRVTNAGTANNPIHVFTN